MARLDRVKEQLGKLARPFKSKPKGKPSRDGPAVIRDVQTAHPGNLDTAATTSYTVPAREHLPTTSIPVTQGEGEPAPAPATEQENLDISAETDRTLVGAVEPPAIPSQFTGETRA
jgi:hypothetical protein